MRVSVVVPVYNEEKTVATVLELLSKAPLDLEVVVVEHNHCTACHYCGNCSRGETRYGRGYCGCVFSTVRNILSSFGLVFLKNNCT